MNNDYNDFMDRMLAMKEVIRINNPEKYERLSKKDGYWAPEIRSIEYSNWVNANYEINPNDALSLSVYSLLTNMPIYQLREKMISELGNVVESKAEVKNDEHELLYKLENLEGIVAQQNAHIRSMEEQMRDLVGLVRDLSSRLNQSNTVSNQTSHVEKKSNYNVDDILNEYSGRSK